MSENPQVILKNELWRPLFHAFTMNMNCSWTCRNFVTNELFICSYIGVGEGGCVRTKLLKLDLDCCLALCRVKIQIYAELLFRWKVSVRVGRAERLKAVKLNLWSRSSATLSQLPLTVMDFVLMGECHTIISNLFFFLHARTHTHTVA